MYEHNRTFRQLIFVMLGMKWQDLKAGYGKLASPTQIF
jgi:hypothetical protein